MRPLTLRPREARRLAETGRVVVIRAVEPGRHGDLLKTPHYRDGRTRAMRYLYHVAVNRAAKGEPEDLYMVPTSEIEPRIERLKGQVPPGVDAREWAYKVRYYYMAVDPSDRAVDHYILGLMIADADAREAGPIPEDVIDLLRTYVEADIRGPEPVHVCSDDARAILARANLGQPH